MDIKTSFIPYICNQITNIEVKMVLEMRLSNMFSFRDDVTLDLPRFRQRRQGSLKVICFPCMENRC